MVAVFGYKRRLGSQRRERLEIPQTGPEQHLGEHLMLFGNGPRRYQFAFKQHPAGIEKIAKRPSPGLPVRNPAGERLQSARRDFFAVEKRLTPHSFDANCEMVQLFTHHQHLVLALLLGVSLWLAGRRTIRKSTRRSYEAHVRLYLKPHLGHLPIDRLRVVHIAAMFDAIDADNEFIRAARAPATRSSGPRSRAGASSARPPSSASGPPCAPPSTGRSSRSR